MFRTTLRRVAAVSVTGLVTTAAVLAFASPASAHVSVTPKEAAQGGYQKLTFRVPNERDNASTTKLEVAFPAEHPLASVSVKPVPGWTAQAVKTKLAKPIESHGRTITEAVSRVVWTAAPAANAIQPGQFQEFDVSVGPLPEGVDRLVFKALQTYSNNEVVRWIDEPKGSEEPEHPAPVLTLTPAQDDEHGGASVSPAANTDGDDDAHAEDDGDGPDGVAVTGLVAGLAGLVLGAAALVLVLRRRA